MEKLTSSAYIKIGMNLVAEGSSLKHKLNRNDSKWLPRGTPDVMWSLSEVMELSRTLRNPLWRLVFLQIALEFVFDNCFNWLCTCKYLPINRRNMAQIFIMRNLVEHILRCYYLLGVRIFVLFNRIRKLQML
ncbi:uncharacterized protein ACN427_003802 isoform 1-T3 [Glossina fuscipes fuscipes]